MTKVTITTLLITFVFLTAGFSQVVLAYFNQDKVDFASSLEETLGHLWALEQNLDYSDAELVLCNKNSSPCFESYSHVL